MPDMLNLPSPFNALHVNRVRGGSVTQCHVFAASPNGDFVGYRFPGGYRLQKHLKKAKETTSECSPPTELFFLESRNTTTKKRGYLAAMIPTDGSENQHEKKRGNLITNCDLVLVQGIARCPVSHEFFLSVHIWKDGKRLDSFANCRDIKFSTIEEYFKVAVNVPLGSVTLIYLNAFVGNTDLVHPLFWKSSPLLHISDRKKQGKEDPTPDVECSLTSCDVWFDRLFHFRRTLSIGGRRERFKRSKRITKNSSKNLPWSFQRESTFLYVVTRDFRNKWQSQFLDASSKPDHYFLVPYDFTHTEESMLFVPIHEKDLTSLKSMCKKNPMDLKKFRSTLLHFSSKRNQKTVRVLRIIQRNSESIISDSVSKRKDSGAGGNIVCFKEDNSDVKEIYNDAEPTQVEGVYRVQLSKNIDDTKIGGLGLCPIFRGYQWPFITSISEDVYDLLSLTYPKKGLIRSSVPHRGNFEMIGRRTSCQSTGSMCALPKNTKNHQYYRASMHSSLLPLVRGITNSLHEEALISNYTSGESLMAVMMKSRGSICYKDLSPQTIITQNHFCNAIHFDNCFEDCTPEHDQVSGKILAYVDTVKKNPQMQSENKTSVLPKSTTCCWKLRKKCQQSTMFQFFVGISAGFAFDISSSVTESLDSVGATFQSSLFEHCTSVPVWVDNATSIVHMDPPFEKKNYNFAWGPNGKKQKEDDKD
jgi:hypothetical protein